MTNNFIALDIASLQRAYHRQSLTPEQLINYITVRSVEFEDHNIFIQQLSQNQIQLYLDRLNDQDKSTLPLYGIPFVIKDNIDLDGVDTTAACEAFRNRPKQNAFIVDCLIQAGAIPIAKTNMDQFATGLVGTRSPTPWGPCRNALSPELISGGSSSGSAVAVALGLASFSLGTDTAGSGRVPAMLNNIYGHKPSRGLLSMSGVVPACRSLDCPSIFALTASDAKQVFDVIAQFDVNDSYARPKPYSNSVRNWGIPKKMPTIGVPLKKNLDFFGNQGGEQLFWQSLERWEKLGATLLEIDIDPLLQAANLLYDGPWVAERYAALRDLLDKTPECVHPVVREIVMSAKHKTAIETFEHEYQMQDYRRISQLMFEPIDFLLTPTAPTTFTIKDLLDNPVELNSIMGHYTNYLNLLDLAGTAVPVGIAPDDRPFGVTLIAPAMQDQALLSYAHLWQSEINLPVGALNYTPQLSQASEVEFTNTIQLAVCGAHLSGMPLNWQLSERDGRLVEKTTTSEQYKFYALAGGPPYRPGLVRDHNGAAIEIEIWEMPSENFGSFVAGIPAPLGIGKVETIAGEWITSFICEPYAVACAHDITEFRSWRAYVDSIH